MKCAHTCRLHLYLTFIVSLGLMSITATAQDTISSDPQIELNSRGVVAFRSGKLQEAAELFGDAVRSAPNDAISLANLGQTLYVLGRLEDAAAAFEQAAALDPRNPNYHNALAIAYGQIGRTSAAITAIEKALAINETGIYYYNLGNILVRAGETKRALPFLEKAARFEPTNANVRCELGRSYMRLSKHAKAVTELEAALMLDKNFAEARKLLGEIYLSQGNRAKALAEYRQLRDSGSPLARELFDAIMEGRVVRVSTVNP